MSLGPEIIGSATVATAVVLPDLDFLPGDRGDKAPKSFGPPVPSDTAAPRPLPDTAPEPTEPRVKFESNLPIDPTSKESVTSTDSVFVPAADPEEGGVASLSAPPNGPAEKDNNVATQTLQAQILDLQQQATGLNSKLVQSFERIADLEDELVDARGKLGYNNEQIATLEKEREEHLAALNIGLLVEKQHVSSEMQKLMERVLEETQQRGKAESDKNKIEAELDDLSANLFSEANRMVSVVRLARSRAQDKSDQLEKGLKDTEVVILEQQKILASLQEQIEKLQILAAGNGHVTDENLSKTSWRNKENGTEEGSSPHVDNPSLPHTSSVPFSGPVAGLSLPLSLLRWPVQVNVEAFREFVTFLNFLRRQRLLLKPFYDFIPSPSQPGAQDDDPLRTRLVSPFAPNLGLPAPSNPFQAAGVGRHKDFPSLPSNAEALIQVSNQLSQPFLKRMQDEDSDPCLRLDLAPGLGWLNRRTAHTAILDGNLIIEPLFPSGMPDLENIRACTAHIPLATCALCGTALVNIPLGGLEPSLARECKISLPLATSLTVSTNNFLEKTGIHQPTPRLATSTDGLSIPDPDATSVAPSSAPPSTKASVSSSGPIAPPPHQRKESDKTNASPNPSLRGRNIFGTWIGTASPKPDRVLTSLSSGFSLGRFSGISRSNFPEESVRSMLYVHWSSFALKR